MFTFQEVLTFGLFIIALLTYINNIRKQLSVFWIEKTTLENFDRVRQGGSFYHRILAGQTTLWTVVPLS